MVTTRDRLFTDITDWTIHAAGSIWAVIGSVMFVLLWALAGPWFRWSQDFQLFINTTTTIITFWLCFLVLHAQNRDTAALQAKLDALIKVSEASNQFIRVEQKTEKEIEQARQDIM